MMTPLNIMPETWGGVGSAIVTFIFFWDMFRRYCPPEFQRYLEKCTNRLSGFLNPYIQISIHEYTGNHLRPHEAYNIVEAYLSANSTNAKRLKAEMAKENDTRLMLSMDANEKITDVFDGVRVKWISGKVEPPSSGGGMYYREPDRRYYKLEFHKGHKKMITGAYLEHVIERGREIQARNRQRKLYTNGHYKYWSHIVFQHPANFNTLLYGPPGTGKSTMIAAMANLLEYDVYDLELTSGS